MGFWERIIGKKCIRAVPARINFVDTKKDARCVYLLFQSFFGRTYKISGDIFPAAPLGTYQYKNIVKPWMEGGNLNELMTKEVLGVVGICCQEYELEHVNGYPCLKKKNPLDFIEKSTKLVE